MLKEKEYAKVGFYILKLSQVYTVPQVDSNNVQRLPKTSITFKPFHLNVNVLIFFFFL